MGWRTSLSPPQHLGSKVFSHPSSTPGATALSHLLIICAQLPGRWADVDTDQFIANIKKLWRSRWSAGIEKTYGTTYKIIHLGVVLCMLRGQQYRNSVSMCKLEFFTALIRWTFLPSSMETDLHTHFKSINYSSYFHIFCLYFLSIFHLPRSIFLFLQAVFMLGFIPPVIKARDLH